MKHPYICSFVFIICTLFEPVECCAFKPFHIDDPQAIYSTRLSASVGTAFESGRFFDIKGGFTVGHYKLLNPDSRYSISWFRHSYQFQYDVVHSAYGLNANVGYTFFALHGEINFNYRWDKSDNQCMGIAPMLGIDLGFLALRAGPHFYLHNDFTSKKVAFAASLDFYLPSYVD